VDTGMGTGVVRRLRAPHTPLIQGLQSLREAEGNTKSEASGGKAGI